MFDFDKINCGEKDETSSYFIIDLKKKIQPKDNKISVKHKLIYFYEEMFEREAGEYLGKIFSIAKERFNFYFSALFLKAKKITDFSFFRIILLLLRFFNRLVYRFFFIIGWWALFAARFFYFFFFAIFKRIISAIIKTFPYLGRLFLVLRSIKGMGKTSIGENHGYDYFYSEKIFHGARNKIKSIIVFTIVLLAIVLPLKAFTYYKNLNDTRGKVLGASEEAINNFFNAAESIAKMDFNQAKNDFSFADSNFSKAKEELEEISSLIFSLSAVYPNKNIRLAADSESILMAGELAAQLGENLSETLDNIVNKNQDNITLAIETLITDGEKMAKTAGLLNDQIKEINISNLPDEYKEKFILLKNKSSLLSGGLGEFIELAKGINVLLGAKYDKRYLLIFQNNAELRATGGFIGSFALIDFREGKIKNIEVPGGGSYDTEGGLKTLVAAPEPLHLVNPLWHFWDANWWPDWPTSANKLMWFYEKSDGPTVDGVISLTPTVLEKILEIIGPIDMSEEYGVILDHDNFWRIVQEFAEQKQDVTLKPKRIIGDMAAKLIEELPRRLNKDVLFKLVGAIGDNLNQKHILFYVTDNDLQKKIDDYGWGGRLKETSRDYLSVVNTNIAGGKSDRKIKETISHEAKILSNGSIIDTIKIERAHTGIKNEQFTGIRNVDWMRIYVPLGSELLEANGFKKPDDIYFENPDSGWQKDPEIERVERTLKIDKNSGTEIYEEGKHTVFANWSMVDPGQTATVYLKYKLPFKLKREDGVQEKNIKFWESNIVGYYSLLVQKQAGSMPSSFVSDLIIPEEMIVGWKYPDAQKNNIQENSWHITTDLNTDQYWAVILKTKN